MNTLTIITIVFGAWWITSVVLGILIGCWINFDHSTKETETQTVVVRGNTGATVKSCNSNMPPRELQDARKMAEMHFDRFEKEAEKLLADPQSNGDIQIRGPEESILKTRRKPARRGIMSMWLHRLEPTFRTS